MARTNVSLFAGSILPCRETILKSA